MTAAPPEPLEGVSRETHADLQRFVSLLSKWNRRINLVSRRSLDDVWHRHVADSAQLLDHVDEEPGSWLDLGSGGGLPGLVVAICARGRGWGTRFTLVESDQRKCAFLGEAARELDLPADVRNERIEDVPSAVYGVISARALASLDDLLTLSERFAGSSSRLLLLKGKTATAELTDARRSWHIEATLHKSCSDPEGSVLDISGFHRRQDEAGAGT